MRITIHLNLTPEEWGQLNRAASEAGLPLDSWLAFKGVEAARADVHELDDRCGCGECEGAS